jgi:hypothetical protein
MHEGDNLRFEMNFLKIQIILLPFGSYTEIAQDVCHYENNITNVVLSFGQSIGNNIIY